MREALLCLALGLTSLSSYCVARVVLGYRRSSFVPVLMKVLECLGVSVLFLMGNILVGMTLVLAIRTLTTRFISLYVFADIVLVPLSLVQGLAFWWWRERAVPRE